MTASNYFKEATQNLVYQELQRQEIKWGKQEHSPAYWYVILGEEVGEVARAIYENKDANYREELVQVAAVCMAALENWDRNEHERE